MMRFGHALSLLPAALVCALCCGIGLAKPPVIKVTETEARIEIPANDEGEINLGELVASVMEVAGWDGGPVRSLADQTIPLRGPVAVMTLGIIDGATWGIASADLDGDQVVVTVDLVRLRSSRTSLHEGIGKLIKVWFPDAVAKIQARYGTFRWDEDGALKRVDGPVASDLVVLVHGLDEPGWIWRSLGPALQEANHPFVELVYPNDQPIAKSAAMLHDQLAKLKSHGAERITLIGHSMGGLVSRETITNDAYYGGSIDGTETLPAIERLIMIGTPNHGSAMARFQLASEFRDQIVRALSGDGMLIGGFFDGAGEAQDDLEPGSEFLTALNARPWPTDLPTTIIAGCASPFSLEELAAISDRISNSMSGRWSEIHDFESIKKSMSDAVDGLGDGCVALESTRLEGVSDHVVVDGNHVTMIRNWSRSDDRQPPAIAIVLDRLALDREE